MYRYAGGLTLNAVYGYQPKTKNDEFLELANESVDILSNEIASGGGIWPVDVLPFRMYYRTSVKARTCGLVNPLLQSDIYLRGFLAQALSVRQAYGKRNSRNSLTNPMITCWNVWCASFSRLESPFIHLFYLAIYRDQALPYHAS